MLVAVLIWLHNLTMKEKKILLLKRTIIIVIFHCKIKNEYLNE